MATGDRLGDDGDPAFAFSVDAQTGDAVDEGGFITTRNGKLRNDHPYISAVAVVSQRDRAIDFYDELVAGMGGASADEKWQAINAAKDRGEFPRAITTGWYVYRTMSAPRTGPGELFNGSKTAFSSTTRKLAETNGPVARRPRDRHMHRQPQQSDALAAPVILIATAP